MFFLILLMIGTFSIRRSTPFVGADPYIPSTSEATSVTSDTPLTVELNAPKHAIRSICLKILPAETTTGNKSTTTISLFQSADSTEPLSQISLANANHTSGSEDIYEWTLSSVVEPDNHQKLVLKVTSDAASTDTSLRFVYDQNGNIWSRMTYVLFGTAVKLLLTVGISILLAAGLYFVFFSKQTILNTEAAKPERFFLLASIILGVFYIFLMPLFLVPDSVNHYVRAYGIAHGAFLIPSNGVLMIPRNLVPYVQYSYSPYILWQNFANTLDSQNLIGHDAVNMALYSPICYVLQAVAIFIADLISNNTYVLVLAGTLANYIGCTAILYFAIKYVPQGKYVLTALALLPISLQERASLSVDAITFAMVVACIAFVFWARNNDIKFNKLQLTLLYCIVILTASSKIVYFLTVMLVLIIPNTRFESKRSAVLHKTLCMVLMSICSVGWVAIAQNYLTYTRGGGDASAKVNLILHNPVRYFYILCKTLWDDGGKYFVQMIGNELGSTNIIVSALLMIMITIMICRLYFEEKTYRTNINYGVAAFSLILSAGMLVLVCTSLYIQWTSIDAATYSIEGLQGRYFLPVMPLIAAGMLANDETFPARNGQALKPLYFIYGANILALIAIFNHGNFIG